jgi:hypothetical protein
MNRSPAARVANRMGRPNTHFTAKCLESSGPDCSLQRTDMDVEFVGKLIERQWLVLSRIFGDRIAGTLQHRRRNGSAPAVPSTERLQRDRQECGERTLFETKAAAQIANLRHAAHTMPFVAAGTKRPPAFMADDQRQF